MTITPTAGRIHPLAAGAAISVTVLALVGSAAILGWLPTSHSANGPEAAVQASAALPVPVLPAPMPAAVPAPPALQAAPEHSAPVAAAPVVRRAQPVHHTAQPVQVAQVRHEASPPPAPAPAPVQQAPAQPNYLGIGAGAVIGGLLGNQVGSGRGRTLATIAGAVGGGYLGNEVQKQTQAPPSN